MEDMQRKAAAEPHTPKSPTHRAQIREVISTAFESALASTEGNMVPGLATNSTPKSERTESKISSQEKGDPRRR